MADRYRINQRSFPQISTGKNLDSVTNNLYRGFRKDQARYMRASSPNQFSTARPLSGFQSAAKSLFWKILPVSPCHSRFCEQLVVSPPSNLNEIKILAQRQKKIARVYPEFLGPPAGRLRSPYDSHQGHRFYRLRENYKYIHYCGRAALQEPALSLSKGPRKACGISVGFRRCVRASSWKIGASWKSGASAPRQSLPSGGLQPLWSMFLAAPV
jgi:hypothetical protein